MLIAASALSLAILIAAAVIIYTGWQIPKRGDESAIDQSIL